MATSKIDAIKEAIGMPATIGYLKRLRARYGLSLKAAIDALYRMVVEHIAEDHLGLTPIAAPSDRELLAQLVRAVSPFISDLMRTAVGAGTGSDWDGAVTRIVAESEMSRRSTARQLPLSSLLDLWEAYDDAAKGLGSQ